VQMEAMEISLEAKNKEIAELTSICDELISKAGTGAGADSSDESVTLPIMLVDDEGLSQSLQADIMLTDINNISLAEIGIAQKKPHLGTCEFPNPMHAFPLHGIIYKEGRRLMVCLPCRECLTADNLSDEAPILHVWFLLDTGSSYTVLDPSTMLALKPGRDANDLPLVWKVSILKSSSSILCKRDSRFPEVNILGMTALQELGASIITLDWKKRTFCVT